LQSERLSTEIGPSPANVRLITRNCKWTVENKELRPFAGTVLHGEMLNWKT